LAHWIAIAHIKEAEDVYNWVYELYPGYTPVENISRARLYKLLGFKNAEGLVRLKNKLSL
jgi:hypothetical protein